MIGFDKPVTRRTTNKYRFSISGAYPSPEGKRLIVELSSNAHGDFIKIHEERLQTFVELDIAQLYAKSLLSQASKKGN
jgi:hypothetical protein